MWNILLKKTIERLSRNLEKFCHTDRLLINLSHEINGYIRYDTPIIIDLSDIVKKYGVAFENMGKVRDGSTKEINMDGYYLIEALIYNYGDKLPKPFYSDLFSQIEPGFKSENEEVIKCLDKLRSLYGTKGIYTMDRGMDNILFFNYFENHSQKFVIRLKKNRNVIYKDKLEDVRVQSYQRLKNINFLLTMAISYISLASKSMSSTKLIFILQGISKRIYGIPPFPYYSTADGMYEVLKKCRTGILEFLDYRKRKPKSQQISLFESSYCKDLLILKAAPSLELPVLKNEIKENTPVSFFGERGAGLCPPSLPKAAGRKRLTNAKLAPIKLQQNQTSSFPGIIYKQFLSAFWLSVVSITAYSINL